MKRTHAWLLLIASLVMVGVALGQGSASEPFTVFQQLGAPPPVGVRYNPNFDQFALVTADGRLLLVDARNFTLSYELYESGTYNGYSFSHDGRSLALAIDKRVELWDTQTGKLDQKIAPEGALSVTGPLQFSEDDSLLLFTAVVPASQATRVSENDTDNLPWLWDLRDARNQAPSRLPGRAEAYNFFDYRNGFYLGPGEKVIAAMPDRLQVLDVSGAPLPIINEIATARYEQDPVDLWYSARGDQMYVRTKDSTGLIQIHPQDGSSVEIPLGKSLAPTFQQPLATVIPGAQSRVIGVPDSRVSNSLLRMLLGDDYLSTWGDHPITARVIDVLDPVTPTAAQTGVLIAVLDETTGQATYDLVHPEDVLEMALNPDDVHLAVRRTTSGQPVEIYNLATGILENTIYPALADSSGHQILTYNAAGDEIIVGYERFKAADGQVVYQLLDYNNGYDSFYFSSDSQQMVTVSGSDWWRWDLNTDAVIQREHLELHGDLLATSEDGQRYLTALSTDQGVGREVLNVATGERSTVYFDQTPDMQIQDVVASPQWDNFLVIYSVNPQGPQYPNGTMALYNIHDGRRWLIAGADLPTSNDRSYGWIDDNTAYIGGDQYGTSDSQRIYGLNYDASGLPACLVSAYPDHWQDWRDLWDRLTVVLSTRQLGRLTQQLCAASNVTQVEQLFTPTPTATPAPVGTAVPLVFAGVPQCLTQYFSDDPVGYAQEWRRLTEGLTPEQVANLQTLLCEGLDRTSPFDPGVSEPVSSVSQPNYVWMSIDIQTGRRALIDLPPQPSDSSAADGLNLVLDSFRRWKGFYPSNPVLSPDHKLLAVFTVSDQVLVYRLTKPYDTLIAEATATTAAQQTPLPHEISIRPTSTPLPQNLGLPLPTLTPTIVPTIPPTPAQVVDQSQYGQTQEVCPANNTFTIAQPPPDYAAVGRLLITKPDSPVTWVINAAAGDYHPDETLPAYGGDLKYTFSFDQSWVWTQADQIKVSRPDGSNSTVLFRAEELSEWPQAINWIGNHMLELSYTGYLPDQAGDAIPLLPPLRRADQNLQRSSSTAVAPQCQRSAHAASERSTQRWRVGSDEYVV